MVMGSAWRKNNLRELRRSLGRWLAILAIIALGIGFFAVLKASKPAMLLTAEGYLRETGFYDLRLISTLGLTHEGVSADACPKRPMNAWRICTASPRRTWAPPSPSARPPLTTA